MPLIVESELTRADWAAYQKLFGDRLHASVGLWRRVLTVGTPLALGAGVFFLRFDRPDSTPFFAFCLGFVAMFASLRVSARHSQRLAVPDENGLFLGSVRMELSSEGIRILRRNASALTQWSGLKEVTVTDAHVFLWLDRISSYIVPRRDLPGGDPQPLLDAIREHAGDVRTTSARERIALLPSPAEAGAAPGFLSTLVRRLTWRAVPATGHGASDAMILTCGAAALAVWLAFDRYGAGTNASWYLGGITDVAWYASGVVVLAWVASRPEGAGAMRPLLAALASALPLLLAAVAAIRQWAPDWAKDAGYALVAFALLFQLYRGLTAAGVAKRPVPLLVGALFLGVFAAVTSAAWIHPHLWFEHEDDDDKDSWTDSEHMLFAQPDRIDAAVARMADGRDHRPDVFFLGFAGVADEKVFAEELKLTERVVTERYRAVGRSLLLVNDKRDHDSWPIATVQGLRRALVKVAARMDRTEDVLFLMLTSHGSDEPSLSISNGSWPLEQLDGKTLRAALDDAGIRWRVIVISACHSGAFIEPLSDPGTIVLTASAKDRTSFGCGDENDVTYFGAALMRDALPQAESLASAFDHAKQLVAEREQQQKLPESKPQAYYGSAIRPLWQQVEAERRRQR
jgi:hypothetical protein